MLSLVSKGIVLYQFESLRGYASVAHFVSGRYGGVSEGACATLNVALHVGDDPQRVLENRRRLASALGTELTKFVFAEQVHGDNVASVTAKLRGSGALEESSAIRAADALVTSTPGIVLTIMIADCVPILLYDPAAHVVAVVHAGWRGSASGILEKTIDLMRTQFGSKTADLVLCIGPSVGVDTYSVRDDVADIVRTRYGDAYLKWVRGQRCLDLWALNRSQAENAGVPSHNIYSSGINTMTATDRFFSNRVEPHCGRFAAGIVLNE